MPDSKRPNEDNTIDNNSDKHSKDELWGFIEEENDIAARQAAKEAARAAEKAADDGAAEPLPDTSAPKAAQPKGSGFVRFGFYVSLFIALVCTVIIGLDYYRTYQSEKAIRELQEEYNKYLESASSDAPSEPVKPGERTMLPQLVSLYEENDDIVGWITLKDTIIDFPVMQGIDNDEYLRATFKRQYSLHGIPFVDYRIDLSNQPYEHPDNLIIYGHNINDGLMFNDFLKYADTTFYTEHPIIEVSSLYDTRQFKVFAAFIANGDQKNGYIFPYHMYLNFSAPTQFDDYIAQITDRSIIDVDLDLEYGDKLLCISTCTYEFDGARFVVFARELREGEAPEANPVSLNPDPLYPAAFTRLYGGRSDS